MAFEIECSSENLHKKDSDGNSIDIFDNTGPASSQHNRHAKESLPTRRRVVPHHANYHLHLHSHHHHHHQHRYFCWCFSGSILLYAISLSLLLLWIGLQISIAQIYLNGHDDDDYNPLSQTDKFLRSRIMNDANKSYGARISYGDSIATLVALAGSVGRGAYNLLPGILDHPSTDSGNAATSISISPQNRSKLIEDDYVFLFYLLLGVNFLAMIPSWCKHFLFRSTKKNHSSEEVTAAKQQEQQLTKEDDARQARIHRKLLQTYLPAYLFATCADWLQGPYKYALYSSYGYTQRDIAHLFVAGYGSGMVLGSVVGGLADSYGRKRLCLFYCLSYTFSVLMKHCKHFYVLLLGRVGGGVATSLLFSVFESWLIRAHGERGLLGHPNNKSDGITADGADDAKDKEEDEKWLAKSLSMSMYGSSLVAIGSGVLANLVVENSGSMRPWDGKDGSLFYVGGYIAAFDACLVPLALCAMLIAVLWEENYGEAKTVASESEKKGAHSNGHAGQYSAGYLKKHSSVYLKDDVSTKEESENIENEELSETLPTERDIHQRKEGMCSTLTGGMRTVWNTPNILICCIIGSIFEGAMYIFVFLWTPALTSLQHGLNHLHGASDGTVESTEDPHADGELPFGWIFSTFMVCCMLGTIAFSRLSDAGVPASKCLAGILALSSLSCIAMAWPYASVGTATSANTPQYIGMLVYEFCIGFYYPAMGTVKGTIVPEDQRAAIYNVFRLPLNLLVLVYLVGDFSTEASFLANAALLLAACALQIRLVRGGGKGGDWDVVDGNGKGHDS